MSLRFRLTEDSCLRSVEDLPGIVGAGHLADGPSFTVDHRWEPSTQARALHAAAGAAGVTGAAITESRELDDASIAPVAVTLEDAIAACESENECFVLLKFAGALLAASVEQYAARLDYEHIVAIAQWAIEVRNALAEHLA